jgi:hypothetical protein
MLQQMDGLEKLINLSGKTFTEIQIFFWYVKKYFRGNKKSQKGVLINLQVLL